MKRLLLVLCLLLVVSDAFAASGRIVCVNVSTSKQLIAARGARTSFSIETSSGAPNIYFSESATASVVNNAAALIVGGAPYTNDGPVEGVYTGVLSAVTKSGTAYTCVVEHYKP